MTTSHIPTFGALWKAATADRDSAAASFATLWKGMNTIQLGHNAPLVNMPSRASADLKSQVRQKLARNPNAGRGDVLAALRVATARKAAVVRGPTPVSPTTPAAAATSNGFGGGGYSGNVASRLGQASNPGTTTASAPRPNPNPAPAPMPAPAAPAAPAPTPPAAPLPPKL